MKVKLVEVEDDLYLNFDSGTFQQALEYFRVREPANSYLQRLFRPGDKADDGFCAGSEGEFSTGIHFAERVLLIALILTAIN